MAIDAKIFDRDFYLANNPDVAASNMDPYQHYHLYGWREGRDPNRFFDTSYYMLKNPDVAQAAVDPLEHYMLYGWREGRNPSAWFDTKYYLSNNPDVAAGELNPLYHFLAFGWFEGRLPKFDSYSELQQAFDRSYYLRVNTDVAAGPLDAYFHYKAYGKAEGRSPNGLFDKAFYLAHNPDVAAGGLDPLYHFLNWGWREGRDPSALFSLSEYRLALGTPAGENPFVRYLTVDRYSTWLGQDDLPQIIQARGATLNTVLVGNATFTIGATLTHVIAPLAAIGGHDLSGFIFYELGRSIADITITGTGRLPSTLLLGRGDDRITGTFDQGGQVLNLTSGAGSLFIDATINNAGGGAILAYDSSGATITVRGNAALSFRGGAGADVVTLGSGTDTFVGGGGVNVLNGGGGRDFAYWDSAVRADLLAGTAAPLGGGTAFHDTLVSIEALGGSPFGDILLGDNNANSISGAYLSPSASGNDILAGRDGNDSLWGGDGADILLGGRGTDGMIGEDGNDLLVDMSDGAGISSYASGGNGDDVLVGLFGTLTDPLMNGFLGGGEGADVFIFDTAFGTWGNFGIEFSQIDGDRIDFSDLRNASGGTVTLTDVRNASSTPFAGSTTIDLTAFKNTGGQALQGRIVVNGVFAPSDFDMHDFIFSGGADWQARLAPDLLGLL